MIENHEIRRDRGILRWACRLSLVSIILAITSLIMTELEANDM